MQRLTRFRRTALYRQVEPSDNVVQLLTDSMANGMPVQIEYLNSGWRTVVPYGWHVSKAGDMLIMCYKNGTEVRSYRLDRTTDLYVDDLLFGNEVAGVALDIDDHADQTDFMIPELPDEDEILAITEAEVGGDEPFQDGLDELSDVVNGVGDYGPAYHEDGEVIEEFVPNERDDEEANDDDDTGEQGIRDDGSEADDEPGDDQGVSTLWTDQAVGGDGDAAAGVDEQGEGSEEQG